ncbi:MAG: hypothetical protein F6J94_24825 [Moorea sp. SIO1F2]|uniref:hypothetical protein n=1 Tax=Moorena sp. SIO1F2 TaxID=2607819 RepID=UPI0013BA6253|nr:hypothetical protein [Moorena sp. SIO1F2]NET85021.1 hypothetical protein [Moorena sp. SIO1F2]
MWITFTLSLITLLLIEASGNYAILWQFLMVLGSRGVWCGVWGVGCGESEPTPNPSQEGNGSRESG